HAPLAAREHLLLLHVDARTLGERVLAAGNAVEAGEARIGGADEAVRPDEGAAEGVPLALHERVRLAPVRRIVVARAASVGVCVDGEVAGAGRSLEASVPPVVDRVEPALDLRLQPAFGH